MVSLRARDAGAHQMLLSALQIRERRIAMVRLAGQDGRRAGLAIARVTAERDVDAGLEHRIQKRLIGRNVQLLA